jgi:GNAT superfamily N-acetyltransferase/catechol 2,3-dioxygenase-like lactoylglutathione lyase family enzyme
MLTSSEPVFAVSDVPETVRFYRDVLGFESEWLWDNPPTFGGVRWGKAHVMFCLQPEMKGKAEGLQHWFKVDDIQAVYDRHKSAGAPIISDIANKPWGLREYTVRDINGYHLRFAGPTTYERLKTSTDMLPSHIRIELRKASLEEYMKITEGVGWNKDATTMPRALELSLFCVMAIDTRDGQTVGMTRVCGDGRYYTIWDVMVLPTHQGQKIGSAMMETAMTELRRMGPKGAFVGLFTGKPKFYERLGFVCDHGMHVAL